MEPIIFECEITNEDAEDLTYEQRKLLSGILEKCVERIPRGLTERLIQENYIPDGKDTRKVIEFIEQEGFDVEIREDGR